MWPEGTGRLWLSHTPSTNDAAHDAFRQGQPAPFWLSTDHQTAGRGRRGRVWSDPNGNFAATLLLTPQGEKTQWAQRSFVMALAVADALADLTGQGADITLKWPNDVLINTRKCVGILLESVGACLLIGVGINLASPPEQAVLEPGAHAVSDIATETGRRLTPQMLLDPLAARYHAWERVFQLNGFGPIRTAWLSRAARLGQEITARLPGKTLKGRFDGLDADGALLLYADGQTHILPAADIYFEETA